MATPTRNGPTRDASSRFPLLDRLASRPAAHPAGDGRSGAPRRQAPPGPPRRVWWAFVVILLANWLVMRFLMPGQASPIPVPYTLFKEEAARGNVEAIYSQGSSIEGRFRSAVTWPPADGASGPGGAGMRPGPDPIGRARAKARGPAPQSCRVRQLSGPLSPATLGGRMS